MKKLFYSIFLVCVFPFLTQAAQQHLSSPSTWGIEKNKVESNFSEIYPRLLPPSTALNDVTFGDGSGGWAGRSLAQAKINLGVPTSLRMATWDAKQDALSNSSTISKITESSNLPLWNGSAWPGGSGTSLPSQTGNNGKYLTTNGTDTSWGTPSGAGDVIAPSSATTGNVVLFGADKNHLADGGAPITLSTTSPLSGPTAGVISIVPDATHRWWTDALASTLSGKEDSLGNPGTTGYVLSSTTGGTRSWVAQSGGAVSDTAYGSSWNGVTTTAPSKNAVYDKIESLSVGSPVTSAPTYSDSACTAGQYAFGTTPPMYWCKATNTWDYQVVSGSSLVWAAWSNPTPVSPTFSSVVISGSSGNVLTANMSVSTSIGSGGNGGMALTCSTAGAVTGTYGSGAPGTAIVYSISPAVTSTDTCTYTYTQPGNGLEATSGGADVATVTTQSTTNNSTYSAGFTDNFNRGNGALGANWTLTHDYGTADLSIFSNATQTPDLQTTYRAFYNGGILSSPNYVSLKILTVGTGGHTFLYLNWNTSTNSGYRVDFSEDGNCTIFRVSSDVLTANIGTGGILGSGLTNGDVLRVEISEGVITAKVNNSVKYSSIQDTTYTSGNPGFGTYGYSYKSVYDDFSAGAL